jgi:hypothetical protein
MNLPVTKTNRKKKQLFKFRPWIASACYKNNSSNSDHELHLPATKTLLQIQTMNCICLLPKKLLQIQTMNESGARKSVFKFRPWIESACYKKHFFKIQTMDCICLLQTHFFKIQTMNCICLLPKKKILRIQTMNESGARKSVFKCRPWMNQICCNKIQKTDLVSSLPNNLASSATHPYKDHVYTHTHKSLQARMSCESFIPHSHFWNQQKPRVCRTSCPSQNGLLVLDSALPFSITSNILEKPNK